MNSITAVGIGCVGLMTGACLSDFGNPVPCVDSDAAEVEHLRNLYDPAEVEAAGMTSIGVGRGRSPVARKGNA